MEENNKYAMWIDEKKKGRNVSCIKLEEKKKKLFNKIKEIKKEREK